MKNQLHELLQEDQEPFHLHNYIAEYHKRLHSRKPKASSNFTTKLCKKACFFSSSNSPDINQSPIIPKPNNNIIFLHVPNRTDEMCLEASARIRKPKKLDVNRLASFLKRLKQSSGSEGENRKKKKSGDGEVGVPLKDLLSSTVFIGQSVTLRQNPTFSPEIKEIDQNLDFETEICSSPFRFVLHNDSYNHQTPSSSPPSAVTQIGEKGEEKDSVMQCGNEVEGKEEEEHCSPVSVLDPDPYVDEHEDDIEDDDDDNSSFDMDRSYANVQRAHERLLEKLSRFERLAELDPLELEIRFQEEDFSDGVNLSEEEELKSSSNKRALGYTDQLIKEVLNRPEFGKLNILPQELKKIVKVILTEEELKLIAFDDKSILLDRAFRRLASWKEVSGDTMNTMVGNYIKKDIDGWARKQKQVSDVATHIELAIFEALVEELCEEWLSG